MANEVVIRKPRAGFALPPTEILEKRDDEWTPVVVAEQKEGFVVKDKRKVR